MFIKITSIYDLISLYSLFINIFAVYTFDVTLCIGIFLCVFFQDLFKELTNGLYPSIFKRPSGAMNCNLFNTGGLVDYKSGFPSGHVTDATFFSTMLILRKEITDIKTIFYYNIPVILMGYARIMKGCHNFIQVVAGYILGYILAIIVDYVEIQYYDYLLNIDNKKENKNDIIECNTID